MKSNEPNYSVGDEEVFEIIFGSAQKRGHFVKQIKSHDVAKKNLDIEDVAMSLEEESFYENLFTRDPGWSTPEPNIDECSRWSKIQDMVAILEKCGVFVPSCSSRILDAGCGRGWLTSLLRKYGLAEGLEPIRPVVEYAKSLFPGIPFHLGTPQSLVNVGRVEEFDLIVSSEVIEHVPWEKQADFARSLNRLLKSKGGLIITTPRAEILDQWMKIVMPNQPVEDWLTEKQVERIFSGAGFELIAKDTVWMRVPQMSYFTEIPVELQDCSDLLAVYQIKLFVKN